MRVRDIRATKFGRHFINNR